MIIEQALSKDNDCLYTDIDSVKTECAFLNFGDENEVSIIVFFDLILPDKDWSKTTMHVSDYYIKGIKDKIKDISLIDIKNMKVYLCFNQINRYVVFRYFTKKPAICIGKGNKDILIGRDLEISGVKKTINLKIFSDDTSFTSKLKLLN